MLSWANDNYTILAGDAAATYAGRAWCAETKRWTTVSGTALPAGNLPRQPLQIRAVDIRVLSTTGIKTGVRIVGMVVTDPAAPGTVAILFDKVQSVGRTVNWYGKFPLLYGFQWRIALSGCVATDIVTCSLGYEWEKVSP
jgi:hypothetical protein